MDIRCPQCSTEFTWTRPACPRCWRANGLRPSMLALKLLAMLAVCVVIMLVIQVIVAGSTPELQRVNEPFGAPRSQRPDPVFGERP